jgi:hypothetical protein
MPHRHILATGLYFWSWLVLLNFAADVFAGGFPQHVAVRGAKQATTGA